MKLRFFKNIVLFALIAYTIPALYIEFLADAFHCREYAMFSVSREAISKTYSSAPDILVFGDSRCMAAVLPKKLSGTAISVAIPGGTSIDAYYGLKRYLEHNPAPKAAFLSLTPVHQATYSTFWNRNVVYKYMDIPDMLELFTQASDMKSKTLGEADPDYQFEKQFSEYLIYRINFLPYYRKELLFGKFIDNWSQNQKIRDEMSRDRGHAYFGTAKRGTGLIHETKLANFSDSRLLTFYMKRFFTLSKEHNIKVIFETAPFNKISFEKLQPSYVNGYKKHLQGIAKQFPKALVKTDIFPYEPEHFGDDSHTNENGAKRYSEYLRKKYFSDYPL